MENKKQITDQDAGQVSGGNVSEYVKEHSEEIGAIEDSAVESFMHLSKTEYGALKKLWSWVCKLAGQKQ